MGAHGNLVETKLTIDYGSPQKFSLGTYTVIIMLRGQYHKISNKGATLILALT